MGIQGAYRGGPSSRWAHTEVGWIAYPGIEPSPSNVESFGGVEQGGVMVAEGPDGGSDQGFHTTSTPVHAG